MKRNVRLQKLRKRSKARSVAGQAQALPVLLKQMERSQERMDTPLLQLHQDPSRLLNSNHQVEVGKTMFRLLKLWRDQMLRLLSTWHGRVGTNHNIHCIKFISVAHRRYVFQTSNSRILTNNEIDVELLWKSLVWTLLNPSHSFHWRYHRVFKKTEEES